MTVFNASFLPALAFQPTTPAKLSALGQITAQLSGGSGGTVSLYIQHLNDRLTAWSSLAGVEGEWTLVGQLVHNTPIGSISLNPGPSEQVLFRIAFDDSGGTPPALLSFSVPWTSDVTAPDAPTKPTLQVASTSTVILNTNSLPSGARQMIVEVDSGSGYVPISTRCLVESGYGYLKFRPGASGVQAQGEFNQATFALTGYVAGTTITVRSKTEDNVGNLSDWVISDPVTTATLLPIQTPKITIDDIVLQTGDTSVLKVHRNGITDKVITIDYAFVEDTATSPEDFVSATGTLTFGIDTTNPHEYKEIAINATGSDPKQNSVQYKVVLSNPTNATIEKAEGVVEIQNFDIIPVPTKTWNVTWKANKRWSVTWTQ